MDKKTILIVDDELFIRDMTIKALETSGYDCLEAENGTVALEILQKNHVDIILSDVKMPNGSGIDLVEWVKADEKLKTIPIILMSGYTELTSEDTEDLGVLALFDKPFPVSKLLKFLNEAILYA